LRALVFGTLAAATTLTLTVGAPYLLVASAFGSGRFSLTSIAVLLTVIELAAFLRSPARFAERISAHDLGQRAVTHWRRWLTMTIGRWPYRKLAAASQGDLLERALGDTDALQDLWLRACLPVGAAVVALLGGDLLVLTTVPAVVHPVTTTLALLGAEAMVLAGALWLASGVARAEHSVRAAHAARGAERLASLGAVPELALLDRSSIVSSRLAAHTATVQRREHERDWRLVGLSLFVGLGPFVVALSSFAATNGHGGRSILVVVLVALASAELLVGVRNATPAIAAVVAAAERLESLDEPEPSGQQPWPTDDSLLASQLTSVLNGRAVLDGVSLAVGSGRRIAVTGAAGAGKSTLLRLLARLDDPDGGEVVIGGVQLTELDEIALRSHTGYLPAAPGLLDGIAERVVRLGRPAGDDVTNVLAALGLEASATDRLEHLSRGQAARVALARALDGEPQILFLDEPTAGLGEEEVTRILTYLGKLSSTMIIATHDTKVVAWCDEQVELRDGRVVNR
jgi:ABC-type transport system involved in cytochrome bd biosynthesis fused ATPase/permease subunit